MDVNLEVEGRHALLFDDDAAASFVNSREVLVPWNHDAALVIDRYDVRHLLDRIPPRPAISKRQQLDDVSLVELDGERYRDLPFNGDDKEELNSDHLKIECLERPEAAGLGAYQAVPFIYGGKQSCSNDDNLEIDAGFYPPFEVPECLELRRSITKPPTEKLHQIMARTAMFVSVHGGQSEIILRVKQGDNPTFGFLMPNHQLHDYFRYLVDHPQLLIHDTDSTKKEESSHNHTSEAGALSLLGSVYGYGDDDDSTLQINVKESEPCNLLFDGIESALMKSENGETSMPILPNSDKVKLPASAVTKENILSNIKIIPGNATTISPSKIVEDVSLLQAKETLQSYQNGKTAVDLKPLVLEPPYFLKRTIEKIIEFILRNGKQFEAVLIEQDKNIGRFSFLISTDQYHSYYVKVFEEAQKLKMQGKNLFEQKNDAEIYGGNKKMAKFDGKDAYIDDRELTEISDGVHYNIQRKEKFKMVLGGQKKDSQDQVSNLAKHTALTADEAAAIVFTATRGASSTNIYKMKSTDGDDKCFSGSSGATAARGLAVHGASRSDSNVSVATVIAKTAALAASREADSAEAGLSREQKVKAERLKRAKMFASLIKKGGGGINEMVSSVSNRTDSMETSTGGSAQMATGSNTAGIEREGSTLPIDGAFGREVGKRIHSRSSDYCDDSDDHKHNGKKHRSARHYRGKHMLRTNRSSKEKEGQKHYSSSEEEQIRNRNFKRHHHHRIYDHSSDKEDERLEKHRSHSNQKREREVERTLKFKEHSEKTSVSLTAVSDRVAISAPNEEQPSKATEIPNELRAKIRAMLLETL